MRYTEKFLSDIKSQKGIKGKIKRKLFGAFLAGLEAADADNKAMAELLAGCCERLDSVEREIARLSQENVNACEVMGLLGTRTDNINADIVDIRTKSDVLRRDIENLSINIRNNNSRLDNLSSDNELSKTKLMGIQRDMKKLSAASAPISQTDTAKTAAVTASAAENTDTAYDTIDYFDFENHFRGSIDSVKNAQKIYLDYFRDKKNVLDIGCGRGEFLSLLTDNNIPVQGVDVYAPYADYCSMNGFKAVCGDGIEYLEKSEEAFDGIFLGQVVEHLETHQIIRLCETAYNKLPEGGCIVIETPNPTSLAIFTGAFYIDPSHIKPVHPLTMKYYLEKAGFKNISIIFTENSRVPVEIPRLEISGEGNTEEFNSAMKKVSDILFGSQDYAVVAVK